MTYTLEDLYTEVEQQIKTVRLIARGEAFSYSHFIGLYGFRLADTTSFALNDDVIIRPIISAHIPVHLLKRTFSTLNADAVGSIGF